MHGPRNICAKKGPVCTLPPATVSCLLFLIFVDNNFYLQFLSQFLFTTLVQNSFLQLFFKTLVHIYDFCAEILFKTCVTDNVHNFCTQLLSINLFTPYAINIFFTTFVLNFCTTFLFLTFVHKFVHHLCHKVFLHNKVPQLL